MWSPCVGKSWSPFGAKSWSPLGAKSWSHLLCQNLVPPFWPNPGPTFWPNHGPPVLAKSWSHFLDQFLAPFVRKYWPRAAHFAIPLRGLEIDIAFLERAYTTYQTPCNRVPPARRLQKNCRRRDSNPRGKHVTEAQHQVRRPAPRGHIYKKIRQKPGPKTGHNLLPRTS